LNFEDFARQQIQLSLSGQELLRLYNILLCHEDSCDESQSAVLEKIRQELYTVFSIEQLEQLSGLEPEAQ